MKILNQKQVNFDSKNKNNHIKTCVIFDQFLEKTQSENEESVSKTGQKLMIELISSKNDEFESKNEESESKTDENPKIGSFSCIFFDIFFTEFYHIF